MCMTLEALLTVNLSSVVIEGSMTHFSFFKEKKLKTEKTNKKNIEHNFPLL